MVSEMSESVQFIYVTHNKITMEMAYQMSGVTMREPGVSRLVQVDIDEEIHARADVLTGRVIEVAIDAPADGEPPGAHELSSKAFAMPPWAGRTLRISWVMVSRSTTSHMRQPPR